MMCEYFPIPDLSTPEKRDEWFYTELARSMDALAPPTHIAIERNKAAQEEG